MIVAKLTDAPTYRGVHPRLDLALERLTPDFLASVGTEPVEIGEGVSCFRCEYETVPWEETFFEAHRQYLDIQLLLSGEERVDVADAADLEAYEHRGDFWALRGEAAQSVILRPGEFLAVFPGEAHRLKIRTGASRPAVKVVFKVLINEDR